MQTLTKPPDAWHVMVWHRYLRPVANAPAEIVDELLLPGEDPKVPEGFEHRHAFTMVWKDSPIAPRLGRPPLVSDATPTTRPNCPEGNIHAYVISHGVKLCKRCGDERQRTTFYPEGTLVVEP